MARAKERARTLKVLRKQASDFWLVRSPKDTAALRGFSGRP